MKRNYYIYRINCRLYDAKNLRKKKPVYCLSSVAYLELNHAYTDLNSRELEILQATIETAKLNTAKYLIDNPIYTVRNDSFYLETISKADSDLILADVFVKPAVYPIQLDTDVTKLQKPLTQLLPIEASAKTDIDKSPDTDYQDFLRVNKL